MLEDALFKWLHELPKGSPARDARMDGISSAFAAGAAWDRKQCIDTAEDVMLTASEKREYTEGGEMGQRIIDALEAGK